MGQSRCLFVYFRPFHFPIQMTNIQFEQYKLKKRRWCAWDSNPGRQDCRHSQIHWVIQSISFWKNYPDVENQSNKLCFIFYYIFSKLFSNPRKLSNSQKFSSCSSLQNNFRFETEFLHALLHQFDRFVALLIMRQRYYFKYIPFNLSSKFYIMSSSVMIWHWKKFHIDFQV